MLQDLRPYTVKKRNNLDPVELNALKKKYGMSIQQRIYRSKDLGVISESRATQLFRTFRTNIFSCPVSAFKRPQYFPDRFGNLLQYNGFHDERTDAHLLGPFLINLLTETCT